MMMVRLLVSTTTVFFFRVHFVFGRKNVYVRCRNERVEISLNTEYI